MATSPRRWLLALAAGALLVTLPALALAQLPDCSHLPGCTACVEATTPAGAGFGGRGGPGGPRGPGGPGGHGGHGGIGGPGGRALLGRGFDDDGFDGRGVAAVAAGNMSAGPSFFHGHHSGQFDGAAPPPFNASSRPLRPDYDFGNRTAAELLARLGMKNASTLLAGGLSARGATLGGALNASLARAAAAAGVPLNATTVAALRAQLGRADSSFRGLSGTAANLSRAAAALGARAVAGGTPPAINATLLRQALVRAAARPVNVSAMARALAGAAGARLAALNASAISAVAARANLNATGLRAGVARLLGGGRSLSQFGGRHRAGPGGRGAFNASAAPRPEFGARPGNRTFLKCTACAAPAYQLAASGGRCDCAPGYGFPAPNATTAAFDPAQRPLAAPACERCPAGQVSGPDAPTPSPAPGHTGRPAAAGGRMGGPGRFPGCVECPAGSAPNAGQTQCV